MTDELDYMVVVKYLSLVSFIKVRCYSMVEEERKYEMKKEKLVNEFNKINANSNLNEIQKYITKMMEANGFNNTPLELFCYLTEEVGELAKEIRKTEKNMDMDIKKEYESCLKYEIADVFIYLLAICNSYNIDLLEAFKGKERINLDRIWESKES